MNTYISKNNSGNVQGDAILAQSSGMSYGKYKAGCKQDFEKSDYSVHLSEYVIKNSYDNYTNKKVTAFIKK